MPVVRSPDLVFDDIVTWQNGIFPGVVSVWFKSIAALALDGRA